ncbi:hypothetical protein MES5069_440080 [Mesorhizobium escarrei]|uniref:Uncharacterized protein n=1 Tax=Mesorhizobium escarrei TaxID=666018 RepID=A0ABM9E6H5_9HYPH|nr:hypothetical protein MES5069_440080 [Mesorhizobium escarrei]
MPDGYADLLAGWPGPHPVKPGLGETLTFCAVHNILLALHNAAGARPRPPLKDNCQGIA